MAACCGHLFFRHYSNDKDGQSQESLEKLYRLDKESLDEIGHIEVLRYGSGQPGPLVSDGRLLYIINRAVGTEHFQVDVVGPDGRHIRTIRLIGPAHEHVDGHGMSSDVREQGARARLSTKEDTPTRDEDETLDCDVFACGQNRKGELGHAITREQLEPVLIKALRRCRVLRVAAGNETSYFLTEEGKVLCCGLDGCGQLGRSTRSGGGEPRALEHSASIETMDGLPASCRIVQVSCFNSSEHVLPAACSNCISFEQLPPLYCNFGGWRSFCLWPQRLWPTWGRLCEKSGFTSCCMHAPIYSRARCLLWPTPYCASWF